MKSKGGLTAYYIVIFEPELILSMGFQHTQNAGNASMHDLSISFVFPVSCSISGRAL